MGLTTIVANKYAQSNALQVFLPKLRPLVLVDHRDSGIIGRFANWVD